MAFGWVVAIDWKEGDQSQAPIVLSWRAVVKYACGGGELILAWYWLLHMAVVVGWPFISSDDENLEGCAKFWEVKRPIN